MALFGHTTAGRDSEAGAPLVVEQPALALEAAAVAGERAVRRRRRGGTGRRRRSGSRRSRRRPRARRVGPAERSRERAVARGLRRPGSRAAPPRPRAGTRVPAVRGRQRVDRARARRRGSARARGARARRRARRRASHAARAVLARRSSSCMRGSQSFQSTARRTPSAVAEEQHLPDRRRQVLDLREHQRRHDGSMKRRATPRSRKSVPIVRPPAHSGALARARGSVRPARRGERLLVHGLADRRGLPPARARGEQGGLPRDRQARAAARAPRVRRRSRGRLVPGHAAQRRSPPSTAIRGSSPSTTRRSGRSPASTCGRAGGSEASPTR